MSTGPALNDDLHVSVVRPAPGVHCCRVRSRVRRRSRALAVLMLAAGAAAVPSAAPAAPPSWSMVPAAAAQARQGGFTDVSCSTADHCTAVGSTPAPNGTPRALAERWDPAASRWIRQPVPQPQPGSDFDRQLSAVACPSDTVCVATGSYIVAAHRSDPFVETWDGSSWSLTTFVTPVGRETTMDDVACATATSCVAVGSWTSGSGSKFRYGASSYAWNGTTWAELPAFDVTLTTPFMYAVDCSGGASCLALGRDSANRLVSETWDGAAWTEQLLPTPTGSAGNYLTALSCFAGVCIATGEYSPSSASGNSRVLAERWDGSAWTIQTLPDSPSQGAGPGFESSLLDVSCSAQDVCMAIGQWITFGTTSSTVEERALTWDGQHWATSIVPVAGLNNVGLGGLTCLSGSSCLAVGSGDASSGNTRPLVLHWNGSGWTDQAVTNPLSIAQTILHAVTCDPSGTTCEAVGVSFSRTGSEFPTAESWDGTHWSLQHVPVPGGSTLASLDGISCPSTTSCFAVGTLRITSPQVDQPLVEHWDGTSWQRQVAPTRSTGGTDQLASVSCPRAGACFAVGTIVPAGTTTLAPLAESYDGTAWTRQPFPANGATSRFRQMASISCPSAKSCVAVGYSSLSGNDLKPLSDTWDGTSWTRHTTISMPAGARFNAVSCPQVAECTAVGDSEQGGGASMVAANWDGVAWSVEATTPSTGFTHTELDGVSCVAAAACMAVGQQYQIGAGGAAPVAERMTSGTWSSSAPAAGSGSAWVGSLASVKCRSVDDCLAVGTQSFGTIGGIGDVPLAEHLQ
jgi:hypothetical protein